MAYALFVAADYLMQTAIQQLADGDETYIREKLYHGLRHITGALDEGVRRSEQPALYNFKSISFPDEKDGR
jgi:hypothetical protein